MICLRLPVCLLIIILIASIRSRYVDNYLQDGVGLRRPGLRSGENHAKNQYMYIVRKKLYNFRMKIARLSCEIHIHYTTY